MPTVEEAIAKYIDIRDKKAVIAERQSAELAPYNAAQETLENFLLAKLNEDGLQNFKTGAGTAFKTTTTSVKLADAVAFKSAIFAPAAQRIVNALYPGSEYPEETLNMVLKIIGDSALWDMVDFRAGKKGIQAHLEETKELPPGVTVESFTAVNVRRT